MQGAAAFADQFLELRQILSSQGHQASEVHNSACKLMRVLLSFPLLGRPASSKQPFLASIHCYWAKFLFNAACQLLATLVPDAVAVHRKVEVLFTFIGPAPRSLYATLQSNQKSKRQHMQCLDNLREVRSWVEATFGCSHSLYNLQVSPCDWQHFIRARLTFPGDGSLPLPGSRGGSLSTTKQLLLNISNLEEELIRQREAALQRLNWLVDKWMVSRLHFRRMVFFVVAAILRVPFTSRVLLQDLPVEHRAWLLRLLDPSKLAEKTPTEKINILRADLRFLRQKTVAWCLRSGVVDLKLCRLVVEDPGAPCWLYMVLPNFDCCGFISWVL